MTTSRVPGEVTRVVEVSNDLGFAVLQLISPADYD